MKTENFKKNPEKVLYESGIGLNWESADIRKKHEVK